MTQTNHTRLDGLYAAVVADVLDQLGYRHQTLDAAIRPLTSSQRVAGRVFSARAETVDAIPDEPYKLEMAAIDAMQSGDVLVCDVGFDHTCGFWGELLTTASMFKHVQGVVMSACTRDMWKIRDLDFPVFGIGYHPADSKGRTDIVEINKPITIGGVETKTGDLILGDEDGTVIIPAEVVDETLKLAHEKIAGENVVRDELAKGMPITEAFAKYGILQGPSMRPNDHGVPVTSAEVLKAPSSKLGEGPLWDRDHERLYWVDIEGQQLHWLDAASGNTESEDLPEAVCALASTSGAPLLLALAKRIVLFDPYVRRIVRELACIEPDLPENRCNDGKVDPAGRFWIGTMNTSAKSGEGSLYLIGADAQPVRMLDGLTISNGLAWSRDGRTFFHVDSPTRKIMAYDFDPADGSICDGRPVVEVPESMGIPDGMAIDSEDRLWVAHWGDGMVRCWCPRAGSHLQSIRINDPLSTSCTFGGPNLSRLFITSACETPEQPGHLYAVNLGVRGGSTHPYPIQL